MATVRWIGAAPSIAQVDTATIAGTVEVGDRFVHQIGTKQFVVVAASTVKSEVATQIATEWGELDSFAYPEFVAEIEAQANGDTVVFTARTAGNPFTLSVSTTESGGGSADSQTYTLSSTTANSSPNSLGLAANWAGGSLPTDSDEIVFDVSGPAVKWDLDALDALTGTTLLIAADISIGLPDTNELGYPEYRDKFLQLGASSITVDSTAQLINLDTLSTQTAIVVRNTGTPLQKHRPGAFCHKGSHSSSTLNVLRGFVATAALEGEASQFSTATIGFITSKNGDAQVYFGTDCTVGTITKNGGVATVQGGATTITNRAGTLTLNGGAVTTLHTAGTGETIVNGTGTVTTLKGSQSGRIDYSRDPRAKTVTNPVDLFDNAMLIDSNNVIGSLVVDLNQGATVANLELGPNLRLTVGAPS